jgi:regulator of cell morphogenesis and NO signaling
MMVMTEVDIASETSHVAETELEISVDRRTRGATPPDALITFILDRFHDTHRRELPELQRLAQRVEAVHANHPECPIGLADFLAETLVELEAHMAKEEQVLFPTLLSGAGGCTPFAIRRMRMEHAEHDVRLEQLKLATNSFTPPQAACGTWRKLYAGCQKLHDDLRAHIDTENNDLFPMFE